MFDARVHLAQAFFACAFGVFFFYHALAAFELIPVPLPLGGLWVHTTATAAFVLGLLFLPQLITQWRQHAHVGALLAIMTGVAVFHYIENGHPFDRTIAFANSMKLILMLTGLYLIGFYLRKDRLFVALIIVCLVVMVIVTPFLIRTDPFSILDDDRRRFLGEVASYAWFANSVVFVGFAAIAWSKPLYLRALCTILTLATLALLGARAELFGFVLVLALAGAVLVVRGQRLQWGMLAIGAATIVVLAIILLSVPNAVERYMEMLNLGNSNSWRERSAILINGLQQIKDSPLFGGYGYYIKGPDEQGSYVHNAISMWAEFGLIPFILYLALSFQAFVASLTNARARGFDHDDWALTFFVSSFCVILIVVAKSIYWPLPAFAWGLYAARRLAKGGRFR